MDRTIFYLIGFL